MKSYVDIEAPIEVMPEKKYHNVEETMFRSYLIIALRTMLRQKGYTALNILGLALGIAGCMLIMSFVWEDLNWDSFIDEKENIHRMNLVLSFPGTEVRHIANTNPFYVPPFAERIPEIDGFTRISRSDALEIDLGETKVKEEGIYYADANFFEMFSYPLSVGEPGAVLAQPDSMVLRSDVAHIFFPEGDAVGNTLTVNHQAKTVTGIFDIPLPGSSFEPRMLFPFPMLKSNTDLRESGLGPTESYVHILPGSDMERIDERLAEYSKEVNHNAAVAFDLQPYSDLHLASSHVNNQFNESVGDKVYVACFSMVGLFILLLASINYVNLATACSFRRAKEVGLRKVVGARRSDLIVQFLGESILVALMAMALSAVFFELAHPFVSDYVGREISVTLGQPLTWVCLFSLAVGVGLLSGVYPSFVLSAFQPAVVIKGRITTGAQGKWFRRGLVVFQFAITVVLLITTFLVYKQLTFMRQLDLGFDTQQILVVEVEDPEMREVINTVRHCFATVPGVIDTGLSGSTPGRGGNRDGAVEAEPWEEQHVAGHMDLDGDSLKLFGFQLEKGRLYDPETYPGDAITPRQPARGQTLDDLLSSSPIGSILVNEEFVKMIGWDEAIGKKIYQFGGLCEVVGVVKNFHQLSLHYLYHPMIIRDNPQAHSKINILLNTENVEAVVAGIESEWAKLSPGMPLDYSFLDDDFEKVYRSELTAGSLLSSFTILAFVIACFGLIGLASYATERRTREIGIRKVLGASAGRILMLLTREFTLLVLVATLIAWPVAWYIAQRWLENFAYRTTLSWWLFPAAGALALVIALFTTSTQAWRAATMNPADAVRCE